MFLKYICYKAVNTLSDFYVIDKGTTAFMWRKVLGLSRPGIEPRFPACEANLLLLRHRGGCLLHRRAGISEHVY